MATRQITVRIVEKRDREIVSSNSDGTQSTTDVTALTVAQVAGGSALPASQVGPAPFGNQFPLDGFATADFAGFAVGDRVTITIDHEVV